MNMEIKYRAVFYIGKNLVMVYAPRDNYTQAEKDILDLYEFHRKYNNHNFDYAKVEKIYIPKEE